MSETETTNTPPLAEDQQVAEKPKVKRAKTDKSDKEQKPKTSKHPKTKQDQPRAKRGPARPHRRLEAEVIDARITKLQKRLDRAKSQIEDAGRHVEGYLREREFRSKETQVAA